ncbi:MAG: aminotransferase class I/II-fold pyridoxal phosphate-dependent enzyme [Atopobiaceae bacterium]|nr:aminotransferase class I/II-fold pyridoxal phosphate-dependent enzyme [Atopobiaceae bacterium]
MPSAYQLMTTAELDAVIEDLERAADAIHSEHLSLDMARGKPSPEQTALSRPMLDVVTSKTELVDGNGIVDNYGSPDGLPSARKLAAEILDVDPENVVVRGSSSLNLMYDLVSNGFVHGIAGGEPWYRQGTVKFLCPAPGYDRHFAVSASFGIENIPVPMREDGPDMDVVCELVENDPQVKGIWCVPKYANPTGVTYSDEVVRRFASLKPAAPDFRIFWDNAYVVHTFGDEDDQLLNIFDALKDAGNDDLVYEFGSTAKVTFPSSGIAFVTASPADMAEVRAAFAAEFVSAEKFSQFAHARYLRDLNGVKEQMAKHAAIVRPRFELVEQKLTEGLGGLGIATWTHPHGGYFVSFDGPEGSAKAIVSLMKELGVILTGAGATWPYGKDPRDTNIRIAPTFPSLENLGRALDVFVVAVKLVSARLERASR